MSTSISKLFSGFLGIWTFLYRGYLMHIEKKKFSLPPRKSSGSSTNKAAPNFESQQSILFSMVYLPRTHPSRLSPFPPPPPIPLQAGAEWLRIPNQYPTNPLHPATPHIIIASK